MASRIQGITVEIGGDTTRLSAALSKVNKEIKDTQSQLKDVEKLLKLDPGNTELLAQRHRLLSEAVSETREKLETLRIAAEQANQALASGDISQSQYDAIQREIIETEHALEELERQAGESAAALQNIAATGTKLQAVGSSIESVGKKLLPVTAGVTALGTAAVKSAVDFESAFASVTKTVNGTEQQLENIRQGILNLSQSTASSANDIAAVAEAAGQLGVKTDDILQFTETMVRLGDSTNISADEAATAMAKLFNITGTSMDRVQNFGATLVALGNNAATTENDIMNMTTRIAASATQVGMTEQQMLALATSLSSVGLEAEAGGTAISTVITNIDKAVSANSDALMTWAKTAGMSAEEFKTAWETDAYGALQMVVSGMGDASANGESLNLLLDELGVTGIRTSDTMKRLSNASEMMGEMTGIANQAWAENTALTDESNKRYETTAAKLSQLKATLTEVGITFGELLLPYVQAAVEALKKLFTWLNSLDEGTKKIIITIGLIVAAVAPVLIVIGKVVSAVGTIMTIVPKIAGVINTVKTAFAALNATMLANPIVLIIAAIAALVATFIYLWNTNEDFRQFWIDLWENVKEVAVAVWNAIKEFLSAAWEGIHSAAETLWNGIAGFFSSLWAGIQNVFTTVVTAISTFLTTAWNVIQATVTTVFTAIQTIFTTIWNAISSVITTVVNAISGFLTTAWNAIKDTITAVLTTIQTIITTVWESIKSVISTVVDGIETAVSTAFNAIWEGIKTTVTGIYNTIKTGFDNAVNFIKNLASSAFKWGSDIINGIVDGIKSCISKIKDAVGNVAETIRSFLHFSVPEEGPLTDYESWMPDFMGGLAQGIEKSRGMVKRAVDSVASDMMIHPMISTAENSSGAGYSAKYTNEKMASGLINAITDAMQRFSGNNGDIVIPVYVGGTLLDEVVVGAQARQNLRSGGR